jgi:hypothetical protein
MIESTTEQQDQSPPRHALRRNLLGRALDGMQPARTLVARHSRAQRDQQVAAQEWPFELTSPL